MENKEFNIFDNVKQGKFFAFKEVGDNIQGTYISKFRNPNNKYGPQIVYVLKDKDGNIWNCGFDEKKSGFHERMARVLFGQIIGLKFEESRPSDKGNNAKIIKIYSDSKYIDREWLKDQKELGIDPNNSMDHMPSLEMGEGEEEEVLGDASVFTKNKPFTVPEDASPSGGNIPTGNTNSGNEAINAIRTLARTKGLTNESMTQEEADKTIEAYTNLTLTEENLTKIIVALTGFTK